ncbi:MAG TPA: TPM domain-containing protein, partial [Candidatus Dormibacteraeota bacterium]
MRVTVLAALASAALVPSNAAAAGVEMRVIDDASVLAPADRAAVERQAAADVAAGTPVLVVLQREDEDQDATIADAARLMTAEDVQSRPGARDGLVVLVSLRTDGSRHGTAALYAGEALLSGRVPQSEVQRVYDAEMAPRLRAGDIPGAIEGGLAAVARDLVDGPPPPSAAHRTASAVTRAVLDPAALVLCATIVVLAVRRWRQRSVVTVHDDVRPAEPRDAPPAIAGALWLAHVHPSQVRATLLDLARRGAVRMDGGGRVPLRLRVVDAAVPGTGWERALWKELAGAADAEGWVGRPRMGRILRRPSGVLDALHEEMVRRGLFEADMPATRRPLRRGGVAGLVVAGVTAVTAVAGNEPWGWLGVIAGASAAFFGLSVASRLPEITPAGGEAAARWECYRQVLIAAFGIDDPIDWDEQLAHAVALCLDSEMYKRLMRDIRAGYAPEWADLRDRDQAGGFEGMWVAFDGTG